MSEVLPALDYQAVPPARRASGTLRIGLFAALLADALLLAAIFVWNGGRFWGPYLYPPVTIYWAQPIFFASIPFALVALFASGIGLVRPGAGAWKAAAATAALVYLAGFGCVVLFGLL